ncbi:MAG: DNA cytosine methyltransferase [Moorellaceae bacterium]
MINSEYGFHPCGLWLPRQKRPTAIDLFCGAGGASLGLIKAGFEVLAGLDNDPAATVTYTHNLGSYPLKFHFITPDDGERLEKWIERDWKRIKEEKKADVPIVPYTTGGGWISRHPDMPPVRHFFFGDARKITGQQILDALGLEVGEVDLVFGGPPCQGFSTAGKRDVMDTRNSLVFEFARLVLEIRPKVMVFENVPGILTMVTPEGLPVVDAFCRILADGGFGTFDALKKSLLATSGAGAVLQSNSPQPAKFQEQVEQMALF